MRISRIVVISLVGALLVGACGGGGSTGGGGTEPSSPQPSPTGPVETTGPVGETGAGGGVTPVCVDVYVKWAAAVAAASAGVAPEEEASAALEAFAAAAPEEIRDDVEVFVQAYERFIQELEAAGIEPGQVPTPEQLAALERAAKILDDPKVQAASDRISAWFERECGEG